MKQIDNKTDVNKKRFTLELKYRLRLSKARCGITMTKETINYSTNNSNNKSSTAERKANTLCPWCKSSDAVIKEGIFSCTRCSYQIDISTPPEIMVIGWTTGKDKDHLCVECRTKVHT